MYVRLASTVVRRRICPRLGARRRPSRRWISPASGRRGSGRTSPSACPGPDLGDYAGIPISDAARLRAEAWDASIQSLPEWQCRPHSADYIWRGPSNLRISKEVDPVSREITAFHAEWLRSVDRAIYLDGRPHPPEDALHTWAGFSTAKWDGDMLTVTVTHLKEGYLRRNGLPRSDKATLTEHWIRNGDFLTVLEIIRDPVYLTEPFAAFHRLRAEPQPADSAVSVRRGAGGGSRLSTRCRTTCRAPTRTRPSTRSGRACRSRPRAAGRRRCIRTSRRR